MQISGNRGYPVTQTLADLIQAAQDLSPVAVSTDEVVLTLVDLSGIVSRIGALADQLRMLLADRPTVTAHLQQGPRLRRGELRRTLDHRPRESTGPTRCGSSPARGRPHVLNARLASS